jgi:hypothetical protein
MKLTDRLKLKFDLHIELQTMSDDPLFEKCLHEISRAACPCARIASFNYAILSLQNFSHLFIVLHELAQNEIFGVGQSSSPRGWLQSQRSRSAPFLRKNHSLARRGRTAQGGKSEHPGSCIVRRPVHPVCSRAG